MMHDWELTPRYESPMMTTVYPEIMMPLIRHRPEAMKVIGIQLKGQIENLTKGEKAVATLEAAITPNSN